MIGQRLTFNIYQRPTSKSSAPLKGPILSNIPLHNDKKTNCQKRNEHNQKRRTKSCVFEIDVFILQ